VRTATGLKPPPMPPDSNMSKERSRYLITEFGFRKSTSRVLRAWVAAREEGTLHVEYLGVKTVPETGDRPCHVLRRAKYATPGEDGIEDATFYFDRDTWLQVGSMLLDGQKRLVAEYYFRDVKLNPAFPPWQFEPEALDR
jgi:hypothetical protein